MTTAEFLKELKESLLDHEERLQLFHRNFFKGYHKLLASFKKPSATRTIPLKDSVDYEDDFFSLHCILSNSEACVMETDSGRIEFPAGAFVQGALYPINCKKIVQNGGAQFIGYVI